MHIIEFSKRSGLVLCLSLAAAVGCTDNDINNGNNLNTQADVNAAMTSGQASGQSLGTQAMSTFGTATTTVAEANVAAIVHAINDGEIMEANIVLGLTADPSAVAFANRMIQDHTASNQKLDAMLAAKGLTTIDDPVSAALRNQTETEIQDLQAAAANNSGSNNGNGNGVITTGSAPGSVAYMYLQAAIQDHEQGFVLFGQLIQISNNLKFEPDFSSFLTSQRNVTAQHRDDATRRLQNL